jgi:two-component system, NarL family, sensor kinase
VKISVELREDAGELGFSVSDDGRGFDASAAHSGAGLENMRDRVGAFDGRLSVASTPGHGTVVSGAVPLTTATPSLPAADSATKPADHGRCQASPETQA